MCCDATRTARAADWHIPINPGTDSALALGMMHIIIRDGLYNRDYVGRWTCGFDQLRERAAEYPPAYVASLTGIAVADIERLAHDYATTTPAVIRVNYGVQRSDNGGSPATSSDGTSALTTGPRTVDLIVSVFAAAPRTLMLTLRSANSRHASPSR